MTRRERLYPEIKRLREVEGLQWREIGERLGVSLKTAHDYYSDPDGSRHRARHLKWQATDFSLCPECGGRMNHERNGTRRCRSCYEAREKRAVYARLEDVAQMYRDGLSIREIARELGYGPNSQPPHVTQCFRLGLLRPDEYRYPADRRENAHDARWAA
jgi:transposase